MPKVSPAYDTASARALAAATDNEHVCTSEPVSGRYVPAAPRKCHATAATVGLVCVQGSLFPGAVIAALTDSLSVTRVSSSSRTHHDVVIDVRPVASSSPFVFPREDAARSTLR